MSQLIRKRSTSSDKFLLFGAFVVFVSFVIRDAIRDELKDYVSDLNSSQTAFLLMSQNVDAVQRWNMDNDFIIAIYQQQTVASIPSRFKTLNEKVRDIDAQLSGIYTEREFARQTLVNVEKLIPRLPKPSREKADVELKRIRAAVDAAESGDAGLNAENVAAQQPVAKGSSRTRIEDNEVFDHLKQSFSSAYSVQWKLAGDSRNLGDNVLQQSEATLKNREWWLQVATYSSWGVFLIGWAIALFAKTHGFDVFETL